MPTVLAAIAVAFVGLITVAGMAAMIMLIGAVVWGFIFMFGAWLLPEMSGDVGTALGLTKYTAFQIGAAFGIVFSLVRAVFSPTK